MLSTLLFYQHAYMILMKRDTFHYHQKAGTKRYILEILMLHFICSVSLFPDKVVRSRVEEDMLSTVLAFSDVRL